MRPKGVWVVAFVRADEAFAQVPAPLEHRGQQCLPLVKRAQKATWPISRRF